MYPLNRFTLRITLFQRITHTILIVVPLTLVPLLALSNEDPCAQTGIVTGNQTMLDLWYTQNGGPCYIWVHDANNLTINPGDTLIIYRDNICMTNYCPKNLTYEGYLALDADHDCMIRILPECILADM